MRININEIKEDLNQLCKDYINIINKMKENNIINNETYVKCMSNKIEFLETKEKL
ncbi:hypothetical protein [Paraclostridium bifermentans]|uniref:hypothetical protein n=1 Tax=Paraclostridium bifermentans TaxID=1490 RepID=UPI00359C209B